MYICSVGMAILQYARRTSCFSLGLGLAVIFVQFCIVYHSVARERDRGFLAVVMVSSEIFCSFGMYIVRYARRHSCFSLGLGLAVEYFAVLECISYGCARKSIRGFSLVVRVSSQYISSFGIVYRTVAQERDFVFLR